MCNMEDLFGGGKQSAVSNPKDLTPVEYKGLRGPFAQFLTQYLGTGQGGGLTPPSVQGPLAAPVSGQTTGLIDQMVNAAGGGGPLETAMINQLMGTITGNAANTNPFLNDMIAAAQNPIRRAFEQDVVPQLLSRFTGSGQQVQGEGSSAFANAAGRAGTDYLQVLKDAGVQLSGASFEAERQRQMQATEQAAGIGRDQMQRFQTALEASLLPQLVADLGIERGMTEYNARLNALLQAMQIAGGLTQATPAQQSVSKGTSSGGVVPAIAGLFA